MTGTRVPQSELFSHRGNLQERVRENHPLRKALAMCDFSFVRYQVRETYGSNGNIGLDPGVVVKLVIPTLLGQRVKRTRTHGCLPKRLDYLWFLGYGLDDSTPNHSVFSKARRRWASKSSRSYSPEAFSKACFGTKRARTHANCVHCRASAAASVRADSPNRGRTTRPPILRWRNSSHGRWIGVPSSA